VKSGCVISSNRIVQAGDPVPMVNDAADQTMRLPIRHATDVVVALPQTQNAGSGVADAQQRMLADQNAVAPRRMLLAARVAAVRLKVWTADLDVVGHRKMPLAARAVVVRPKVRLAAHAVVQVALPRQR
jgi:hypothetical protein